MDGPELVGEGREAVEVVAGFIVDDNGCLLSRWVIVDSAPTIWAIGAGAVLIIIPTTVLLLGWVAFVVLLD